MSSLLQGCTLNPPDISNRETPARAGQMIDITCNSDSEYNSCFFVHTRPFDVNLPSSHDVDLECSATGGGEQPDQAVCGRAEDRHHQHREQLRTEDQ